jgi:hypothetical protein
MNHADIKPGDLVFNTRNRRAYKVSDTPDWQTTNRGAPAIRVYRWDAASEHVKGRRTFAKCEFLVPFAPELLTAVKTPNRRRTAHAAVEVHAMA